MVELTIVIVAVVFLAVYFLPWIVASNRGHRNTVAIFILNLFLGWSFIAWIIALVWAFTND